MVLAIPKIPKIDDLVTILVALEARLAAVEEQATVINDQRIKTLERFMADHQAGATRRQTDINRLTADNEKLRHQLRTGRTA